MIQKSDYTGILKTTAPNIEETWNADKIPPLPTEGVKTAHDLREYRIAFRIVFQFC